MVQVNAIQKNFVADIHDVDLNQLSKHNFEIIYNAWLKYGVLRIRDQAIDENQLQAFSARFGPLEEVPMGRLSEAEKAKVKNRFVTQLSNIRIDGKPIGGLGNAKASWHSDMTYVETPPLPVFYSVWKLLQRAATLISPINTPPIIRFPQR